MHFTRSFLITVLCAATVLITLSPLVAGTRRADVPDSQYLSLGAQAQYAAVGQLSFKEGGSSYLGSGTLIASDWVLTAAHCVDAATQMTFTLNGHAYAASGWVANPNWNGNLLHGGDIGLVHLSSPVTDVAPATRYTGASEVGQLATIVGYGMTGTGLTGATTYDGKKRAGQNILDEAYGGTRRTSAPILLADFDNPANRKASSMGSQTPVGLEYIIGPGDSGGGVFIDVNGAALLAGVNSFIWAVKDGSPNSSYSDVGGFDRVSVYNSWINGILGNAKSAPLSLDAGLPLAVAMDAAMPEPATLGLLAIGLLAVLRRRK